MKDLDFPTWSGPLAGLLIGIFVGVRAFPNSDVPLLHLVIGGALIGGLAGSFMLLLDRPERQSELNDVAAVHHHQPDRPTLRLNQCNAENSRRVVCHSLLFASANSVVGSFKIESPKINIVHEKD